jgi:hypothetical protein
MKKKLKGKLSLSRETIRTLDDRQMDGVVGGLSRFCSTEESTPTVSCDSCANTTTGSFCC